MLARSLAVVRRYRWSVAAASLLGAAACTVAGEGSSKPVAGSGKSSAGAPASRASSAPAGSGARAVAPRAVQRVVLAVEGMYCASCERTVTVMLRRTPGVRSVVVSVARGEAVVSFDAAQTTPAALVAVIEQLGYHAKVRAG